MPDSDLHQQRTVYRILDANANRAVEGLRVVEDFARFALEDRAIAEEAKAIRHAICTLLAPRDDQLLVGRDVAHDVGTEIAAAGEYQRDTIACVAKASGRRVEQALRCLEEYSKLECAEWGRQFEALRYRAYILNQKVARRLHRAPRLVDCRLCVLVDGAGSPDGFELLVGELVAAGVDLLQLRDKSLTDRELLERARQARRLTRHTSTLLIVNDRPDLARLADADGVQLGQSDLGVADARAILPEGAIVGVSTHVLSELEQALRDGADYVGCGPVFPSQTKSFEHFAGLEYLRAVQAANPGIPAFAIGGISLENLTQVLQTGFCRIAVGQAVIGSGQPGAAARMLRQRLGQLPQPTDPS
jgi:thiamine-phosphate pyrophosphorylase